MRDLGYENRYNYAIDTVLNGAGQPACRSVANPAVLTPVAVSNVTNFQGASLLIRRCASVANR